LNYPPNNRDFEINPKNRTINLIRPSHEHAVSLIGFDRFILCMTLIDPASGKQVKRNVYRWQSLLRDANDAINPLNGEVWNWRFAVWRRAGFTRVISTFCD
jgi:hypothetical protein